MYNSKSLHYYRLFSHKNTMYITNACLFLFFSKKSNNGKSIKNKTKNDTIKKTNKNRNVKKNSNNLNNFS